MLKVENRSGLLCIRSDDGYFQTAISKYHVGAVGEKSERICVSRADGPVSVLELESEYVWVGLDSVRYIKPAQEKSGRRKKR